MSLNCTITIQNEIQCTINCRIDHMDILYDQYGIFTENYRHATTYKLNIWDGKKRLINRSGQTYTYLLSTIVPKLKNWGYTITIQDMRRTFESFDFPEVLKVDPNIFAHINNEHGEPFLLREYQIPAIDAVLEFNGGIIEAGTGAGKAQPLHSLILTTEGWVRMGDITLDHVVITPQNTHSAITGIYPQPIKDVYRLMFHDGALVESCSEHLWKVRPIGTEHWLILDTATISTLTSNGIGLEIPTIDPINYCWLDYTNEPLDSYVYGAEVASLITTGNPPSNIPDSYKYSCTTTRFKVLNGIVQSYGMPLNHQEDYCIIINLLPESLALDIQEIVRSLGGNCTLQSDGDDFKLIIDIQDPGQLYTDTCIKPWFRFKDAKPVTKRIESIEQIESQLTQCISIADENHLYITDNYCVTHNTIISAAITKTYGNYGLRCITIVPTATLVKQSADDFKVWGIDCGQYDGEVKELNHTHLVSTWQSLQNVPLLLHNFDVIIIDECQAVKANVLYKLITEHGNNSLIRIGMTGSMPEFKLDNLMVRIALGDIQYRITADSLIRAGYLSTLNINLTVLDEQIDENFFPDYTAEMSYLRKNTNRNEWIMDFVHDLSQQEDGNVLMLVASKQFGKKFLQDLHKKFGDKDIYFVSGDNKTDARTEIYQLFKKHSNLLVVTTVQIAGVGLSIDRIFNLVMLDLGKSFIRIVQAIGRGLRKSVKAGKEHVNVYDICSSLKYSKVHMRKRTKTYKGANYPYQIEHVKYYEKYVD